MMDVDVSTFNAQKDMPETQNKLNAIADRIPVEFKFLKERYLLDIEFGQKAIDTSARELYDEYVLFCSTYTSSSSSTYKPLTYIKFTTKLKEINICWKIINGGYRYKLSYAELEAIFKKNKWMHQLDEWKYPANYVFPDDNNTDAVVPVDKDAQIAQLIAEVQKLKAQLQAKDNDLDYVAPPEPVKPEIKATPNAHVIPIGEVVSAVLEASNKAIIP